MSEALVKTEEKSVEYIPYGAQDKVKLTVAMVKNLIAVKTKLGKTCSDNEAIKFVAMCQARRLNPFEGDAFLIGYDGKDGPQFSLITAHQAFLKRAELNPEYDGMKSGVIVERSGEMLDLEGDFYLAGDKVLGGWATVFFKNRKQPMHKRVRLERFKKPFGIWMDDAAGMICKCAEADALRSSFPTMLGGLYLKEEVVSVDDKKITKPLFESKTEPAVDVEPLPDNKDELLKDILVSIGREGVTEAGVVEFLIDLGSVDKSVKSLSEVNAETIAMLHSEIGKVINKIKGVK